MYCVSPSGFAVLPTHGRQAAREHHFAVLIQAQRNAGNTGILIAVFDKATELSHSGGVRSFALFPAKFSRCWPLGKTCHRSPRSERFASLPVLRDSSGRQMSFARRTSAETSLRSFGDVWYSSCGGPSSRRGRRWGYRVEWPLRIGFVSRPCCATAASASCAATQLSPQTSRLRAPRDAGIASLQRVRRSVQQTYFLHAGSRTVCAQSSGVLGVDCDAVDGCPGRDGTTGNSAPTRPANKSRVTANARIARTLRRQIARGKIDPEPRKKTALWLTRPPSGTSALGRLRK